MFASVIVSLFLGATGLATVAGQTPAQERIVIVEPKRPTRAMLSREANCGDNRYGITIRSGTSVSERLQSVRVNGREVPQQEKAALVRSLAPTTFVMDAAISECSRSGPAKAKASITVVDKPWLGNKEQLLQFWISVEGRISGVRFN